MHTRYNIIQLLISTLFLVQCTSEPREEGKPNVLFIAVDDLRPELAGYGKTHVKSPHLDNLLAAGVKFERAYCNVPVCGASRASLLTGIRPAYNRFLHYYTEARVEVPGITTLPGHFKKNGYETISIGKIFHTPADKEQEAWSQVPYRLDHHLTPEGTWSGEGWQNYITRENLVRAENNAGGYAMPWEIAEVHDTAYHDGKYAQKAIQYLKELKANKKPFFLSVGFLRPHLPFNAPKKYWDLYDPGTLALANNPFMPENAPPQAGYHWQELRFYNGIPKQGPVSDSTARVLLHGYYASVSYIDRLIGSVLDELKRLELERNTIVVLWGDHGWNLGEHGFWCKHVNFETSLRTTLALSGPGIVPGASKSIVELVDLYPTLLDLCQLPLPDHILEGVSLAPVLQGMEEKVKDYAISKWKNGITYVGERYFYTEWHDPGRNTVARMLYDHENDPDENTNIAELDENADLVKELSEKLRQNLKEEYWAEGVGSYPGH